MPLDRFYIEAPLQGEVEIEGEELHHLKNVVRLSEGQTAELVNGHNILAQATLLSFSKQRAHFRIDSTQEQPPPPPLILAQAMLSSARIDFVIEKAVELGATEIWLFPGEQGRRDPSIKKRLRTIAIAAMKQCGRLDLPQILLKEGIPQWSSLPYPAYFGKIGASQTLSQAWERKGGCLFVVGPESGFSENEMSCLEKLGAKGVTLHPFTLRAETAALCALAQIACL